MHLHFVIHEAFEAPGAYAIWAQHQQFEISYSRVYQGDQLPQSVEHIDFLVIMGGPQSPDTTMQQCPHFDAAAERALILKAIQAHKVVLGICLGSQLIGEALGAGYSHSPEREIGKFPITLTEDGLNHPKFRHFGAVLEVGHWHSDMPGLTLDAKVLAYSEGCPRQIVEYSALVYGFQCHMELTPEVVELLIHNATAELQLAHAYRFVDTAEKLRQHDYAQMNEKLYTFLDLLKKEYLDFGASVTTETRS